ncbi:MAG: LysR family transcriptional regulator, partial [Pseudomonadota bacterium]|nr:LysR family transcriptional regulator [Pseudomonadota bacterium]
MNLNFRQLEVFRAVMIAKTISGAAEILNVSQPGISRLLKYMEYKMG